MNTVVNRLLDVDKHARSILDEAQQYYERTLSDIEAEKKKLTEEYENKAKAHLEEITGTEAASVKVAVAKIDSYYAKMTAELDKAFEGKHTEWENTLFDRCVGR